ncbi:MAG: NAD-dependent epimerase/dehydratase family protein [Ginsengibacter sp.]
MILITGAGGFLGNEINKILQSEKSNILTLGRSSQNDLSCDLSTSIPQIPPIDMVIHCAGKAHLVPKNSAESKDFFSVNVDGTQNLFRGLEKNATLTKFIYISSVAVYGREEGLDINEEAPTLALDPYGQSKIVAEELVSQWCSEKGVAYYIFRIPLVTGINPPGNLKTMLKGIRSGSYKRIGKGNAKKSMVMASDIARFTSRVSGPSGVYNLTDGYHPSFFELENKIAGFYNKKAPSSIPLFAAKLLGFVGDILGSRFPVNSTKIKKITSSLTFDDTKARKLLSWKSHEVLKDWIIQDTSSN